MGAEEVCHGGGSDEHVGHGALDRELRFVAVNDVLATLNGRPVAEHLGRTVAEVLPALAPGLEPLLRQVLLSGQPLENLEIVGETSATSGVQHRWLASYYPVRTRFGVVLGIEAVVRAAPQPDAGPDPSPLLPWEIQAIFTQAPVGILISDLSGRLLDCNPAFCALTGYSRGELLAASTATITHPDDLAADREAAHLVLSGHQPVSVVEKRYLRSNGSELWVQVTRTRITDSAGLVQRGLAFVEDISRRRQIQIALADSQHRFERITRLTPQIVTLYDPEAGRNIYANHDLAASLGYPTSSGEPDNVAQLMLRAHPDDQQQLRELPARYTSLSDEDVFQTVVRYLHADGRYRWFHMRSVVFTRGADDRPQLILELAEDITSEREAREQLARERAWLEEVLRQLPSAVGVAEAPAGRLVLVNERIAEIFRHPAFGAEEVSGYQAYHGYHPDGRPYAPEEWPLARALLRGEQVRGEQIVIERGDGTLGVIEASAGPVRIEGQIVAGVVTFSDVSDRVRAEAQQRILAATGEALTTSLDLEAELRAVTSMLVEGFADTCSVVIYGAEPQPQLLEMAHRDQAVVAQLAAVAAANTYTAEAMEQLVEKLLGDAPSRLEEIITPELTAQLPLRDGDRAILDLLSPRSGLLARLAARGRSLGLLALTRSDPRRPFDEQDRTFVEELARRCALAAENALLYADERAARAEAERSVRLRDEFLAVAAHELKTPLAAVLGLTQLIQRRDQQEGQLGERDRRMLTTIVEQALRLNRMIAELLDVTRIATGHLELAVGPVDLSAIVRQVADELRATAPRHHLVVQLPDGQVLLVGDELRLTQVVSNLVQNAIKYSPLGGIVAIDLVVDAHEARLTVVDQGIGIPAHALPAIFGRYYRAPNTATARIEGMGIGLYLVKEVVELHGGAVTVASTEGAGSTFIVRFPYT